jgi:hypothetical protein
MESCKLQGLVFQDFLSWPTCLDLLSLDTNSLDARIACPGLLA